MMELSFLRTYLNLPSEIVPTTLRNRLSQLEGHSVVHLVIALGAHLDLKMKEDSVVIVMDTVEVQENLVVNLEERKGGALADYRPSFG
ncbi:hypothetical protein TSUD_221040, partial [Trifolium subterraneum]